MRWAWIAGVLHAMIGSTILFMTLHPLRDALDAQALDLAKVASAWQALLGLALMLLSAGANARIGALLMTVGVSLSSAILYFIIFSGLRPPFIVLAPIGGGIAIAGWLALLFAKPPTR